MNLTIVAALAGFLTGCALASATAFLFVVTRPYRRTLNRFVIFATQLIFVGLVVISILLVGKICSFLGIGPHSGGSSAVMAGFLTGLLAGEILIFRAEIEWRKSVGLWQRSRDSSKISPITEHLVQYVAVIALSAFFGGFGAAVLLGPRFTQIPRGLALYATVSSLLGLVFMGYILRKALRRNRSDTIEPPSR